MKRVVLLVLMLCDPGRSRFEPYQFLTPKDQASVELVMKFTKDVIRTTDERIGSLENLRYNARRSAAFEIGYLSKVIQEVYRKQVDKYNTSKYMFTRLYTTEMVLYLEEVEHHYWEVEHISNMLHEIEKKYGVKGGLKDDYDLYDEDVIVQKKLDDIMDQMKLFSLTSSTTTTTTTPLPYTKKRKTRRPSTENTKFEKEFAEFKQRQRTSAYTPTKRKAKFPLDYGWDITAPWR